MALPSQTVRESVGVFDNIEELHETVEELGLAGFHRQYISVVGSEPAREERYRNAQLPPQAIEDDPGAPHAIAIMPEEVGVGLGVMIGLGAFLGFLITALGVGSLELMRPIDIVVGSTLGAIAGFLLARILRTEYWEFFDRQAKHGGLVLWVRSPNGEMEEKAHMILRKHGAKDVHVHEVPLPKDEI